MKSKVLFLLAGLCLAGVPSFGALTFCGTAGCLGSNDSTGWAQAGEDQTVVLSDESFLSALGLNVAAFFASGTTAGLVADACPDGDGSCSWTPSGSGINAGDSLLWAFDNGSGLGTGPILFNFSSKIIGAGAWIEGDTNGAYTGKVEAFNGGSSLGSFTLSSDAAGDPIFLGVLESPAAANITALEFSLTSCAGCSNLGDFVVDTLLMTDSVAAGTPEPSSMVLLGSGLAGMAWILRKKASNNGRRS